MTDPHRLEYTSTRRDDRLIAESLDGIRDALYDVAQAIRVRQEDVDKYRLSRIIQKREAEEWTDEPAEVWTEEQDESPEGK